MAQESRIIKTYMSFGLPVDPSNVKTLVDLDLSYALASTLVDWTDSRNLREGLAKPIEDSADKQVAFKLRPQAKWSDGAPVMAAQVVRSFARAKKLHADDLKSLFEIIDRIEAKDDVTVVFHLNRSAAKSQILHKLTEPMYGVIFVNEDGSADLKKSTGAYLLKSESDGELTLTANPNWYGRSDGMAETIVIRQPKKNCVDKSEDGFSADPWPNLLATSSVIPKEVENIYKKEHFSVWNRNLDRVFYLAPNAKLADADGRKLFQALNQKLDRTAIMAGLSGYHLSQQFFPPGYVIFDPEFPAASASVEVPAKFKSKSLEILSPEGRISATLQHNLSDAITRVTGTAPKFKIVALSDFEKERIAGHYDMLASTLAVNDPNVEGAVSFFFGVTPPFFPNSGDSSGDFKGRVAHARSLDEGKRNTEYRKVFTQAVRDGCMLPLFHFSSVAIARDGIDLSRVPTSDETVAFAKVRFK